MNRIDRKFKELRKEGKKAFIAFITAGYPDLKTTRELILEFDRAGVDIVELGVPFSDPIADGPVIQESSQVALEKNVRLPDILSLVKSVRAQTDIPLCLMTYYNPVFCYGQKPFVRDALSAGVDGLIVPDLPPEEDKDLMRDARRRGLDVVCFISPTSSRLRMKFIAGAARGFIYYVSLTGVTGPRQQVASDIKAKLTLIRRYTSKPVCVGFGVSTASQVRQIYALADGVIVGSAIIRNIRDAIGKPDLVKRVGHFVRSLKR